MYQVKYCLRRDRVGPWFSYGNSYDSITLALDKYFHGTNIHPDVAFKVVRV